MRKTFRLFILTVLTTLFSAAAGAITTAEEDYYRTIMLSGEDIAVAVGKPVDQLSLFAVVDGLLEPVPYQIDEYNQGGAVYFDEWDEPIDGTRGIFDPSDKLLFLFGDSSTRKTAGMRADGDIIAEIVLEPAEGEPRYVYLVEGSRLRSDAQHVRYSIADSRVETDFFSMVFDKENQLIWKDFRFIDYQGGSPIDGLKINFESGVLTAATSMSFNNENFIAKTVGENVGPIRTTTQLHFTFVFMGLTFIDASIQLHFYPNALIYDVRLVIPETRRAMLVDPTMALSVDFNNLVGATVHTNFLEAPLEVDGAMSEREQAARGTLVAPEQNGLLIKSGRGFEILTFVDWIGEQPLPTRFYYEDNLTHQGAMDRFEGQLPDIGYQVSDFPEKGLFGYVGSLYFSDEFSGDTPKEVADKVRTSPTVRINEH
ncbi:MAG: hypothetical protein R3208_12405 [Ketobacteraceae bacterium]|nr:hypothetical protein [Ketobacteraceae bacterium]